VRKTNSYPRQYSTCKWFCEDGEVEKRVNEIKAQIEFKDNESEKLLLKERLSKLEGGVAILKIGAYSEVELKEKKDRLDDALSATRAAIEEGILPGGGIALLNASFHLRENPLVAQHPDQEKGFDIVMRAIRKPFEQILLNAGETQDKIEDRELTLLAGDRWQGFNPRTGQYVDMLSEGIIDPTKVTRLALENAASVAGTMLITECVITTIKQKSEQSPGVDPSMFM